METSELIKFGILTLIVVVIAFIARRGQAHATPPAPPKKADHVTEEVDADNAATDVQRQKARTRARLDRLKRNVVSDDDAVE